MHKWSHGYIAPIGAETGCTSASYFEQKKLVIRTGDFLFSLSSNYSWIKNSATHLQTILAWFRTQNVVAVILMSFRIFYLPIDGMLYTDNF